MDTKSIVFLGDSLMEFCDWQKVFNNKNIINQGISGDTTFGILQRIELTFEEEPKKIFLMAGINDLLQSYHKEELLSHYEKILEKIKSELPLTIVYVHSILPVADQEDFADMNHEIKTANTLLQALAQKYKYPYVDLHAIMSTPKGALRSTLSSDGLHLNSAGYDLWRDSIKDLLATGTI